MARPGVRSLLLLSTLAAAGCAGTTVGSSDEPTVELVIHNERSRSVAAYVQWPGLRSVRLGVIAAGSSATYLPAFRGALCVSTTETGNTSFSTAVPERSPPGRCQEGIPVERGQRMDVFLHDDRTCYLQYDPSC